MGKSKTKQRRPDDYVRYGPIELARFGKEVVMRNNMTDEEHQDYINSLADQYQEIKDRIDLLVNEIRDLVASCNPLALLQQSYWSMFMSMLNKTSEFQYGFDQMIAVRMIDYVQSVLVSTDSIKSNDEEGDTDKWHLIYEKVAELYRSISHFHICHSVYLQKTDPNYNEGYNSLYVQAQELRTTVRGQRYPVFEFPHYLDLLLPHDEVFQELFGISIEEFLKGIEKMQMSLMCGMNNLIEDLDHMMEKTAPIIEQQFDNVQKNSTEKVEKLFEELGLKEKRDSFNGRFFGYDLFDVEKVTGLPRALIEELSWNLGEETSFYSDGEYTGWPLRRLPIEERPFICIEDKIYCFEYYSLFDNLYRVIQRLITRLKPEYKKDWNEKQKQVSEELPFELFRKLLPRLESHKSIYYQSNTGNTGKKQWCECDGIIEFDSHLIVIEVKAGSFTYTHPSTDFSAFIKSIENLAKKPHEQATRFIETLKEEGKVIVCNEEHVPIKELKYDDYRHITSCSVTIDNFNEFAARIDKLSPIGIQLGDLPSWNISIDELRVYADYFESPSIFLHFLEQRLKAAQSPDLEVIDELDHLGMYIEHNRYLNTAKLGNGNRILWHGYREELDNYFSLLVFPDIEKPKKPQQEIPVKMQEIIDILEKQGKSGFTRVASTLLDIDFELRVELDNKMNTLLERQADVNRIMPLNIFEDSKITLICNQDEISNFRGDKAKEYVLATMLKPNDDNRLALYLDYNSKGKLYNVDFEYLTKDDIPPEREAELIELSERYAQQRILSYKKQTGIKKIGRNDPCPCGSGLKHKKCCGK
ncbi:YecA family protein [Bacillus sp. Marseille-Q1617]|uniref:YecA family protein n=1 Tax=Bacillus sp. Marseille-Q1617 TaxID=2736887 RepID=UPI00158AA051|nr:SEC-C metal-binding domain-containing protein [Bacillus sp. Marseille-Q1617]